MSESTLSQALFSRDDRSHFSTLSSAEEFWKGKGPLLSKFGYELRPRYRPDWQPSWLKPGGDPNRPLLTVEDAWRLPVRGGNFIDATRVSDQRLVYLKQVVSDGPELQLMMMLSNPQYRDHPQNHCVPLLDVIEDDEDPAYSYMVMPFLRPFDSPEFQTVDEFINFVDQLLEGLVFLHEVGIAHRDCSYANIMMDAHTMYPDSFHPVFSHFLPDLSNSAWPLPRSSVGVRYYFIDFGLSSYFPPGASDSGPRLVRGIAGRDRDPPELSSGGVYDPFKLDVFIVGNLLRTRFLNIFSNLAFLQPLVEKMVQQDPSARPDAPEILGQWRCIKNGISYLSRSWRLRDKRDSLSVQLGLDMYGILKGGMSNTRWRRYM